MRVTKPQNKVLAHETSQTCRLKEHHFVAEPLREQIEKKAYELYEGRGCVAGRDLEDWLEAERVIKEQGAKI